MTSIVTNEAQRLIDELAEHVRGGKPLDFTTRDGSIGSRIVAAATKPKHPAPDQFYELAKGESLMLGLDSRAMKYSVVTRQLEASNHAIAHLRKCVGECEPGVNNVFREAAMFLRTLDAGTDFPEMPK